MLKGVAWSGADSGIGNTASVVADVGNWFAGGVRMCLMAACDGAAADRVGVAWVAGWSCDDSVWCSGAMPCEVVAVTLLGTDVGIVKAPINASEVRGSEVVEAADELAVVVIVSGAVDGAATDAGYGIMGALASCDGVAACLADEVIGGYYTMSASLGGSWSDHEEVELSKWDLVEEGSATGSTWLMSEKTVITVVCVMVD